MRPSIIGCRLDFNGELMGLVSSCSWQFYSVHIAFMIVCRLDIKGNLIGIIFDMYYIVYSARFCRVVVYCSANIYRRSLVNLSSCVRRYSYSGIAVRIVHRETDAGLARRCWKEDPWLCGQT